jgi:hypothetical protein
MGGRPDVAVDVDDQHLVREVDLEPVDLSETSHSLVVKDQPFGLREDLRSHHDPARERLRAARLFKRVAEPGGSTETDDRWAVIHNTNLATRQLVLVGLPEPQNAGCRRRKRLITNF